MVTGVTKVRRPALVNPPALAPRSRGAFAQAFGPVAATPPGPSYGIGGQMLFIAIVLAALLSSLPRESTSTAQAEHSFAGGTNTERSVTTDKRTTQVD